MKIRTRISFIQKFKKNDDSTEDINSLDIELLGKAFLLHNHDSKIVKIYAIKQ